jgi:2-pyrone-4,6-dicarboxylate lactonase
VTGRPTSGGFEKTPGWLDWYDGPSTPTFALPAGAVDTHCHVFGPGAQFPYAQQRKYTPCDASAEQLFALRDHLGFARNVIVQATCHGADNSAMVDALRRSGGRARGIATVQPGVSAAALAELHDAGVRGVRFNFVRRLVDEAPESSFRDIIAAIAPLGWHVVIYFEAGDLAHYRPFFDSIEMPLVVDHMGTPDVHDGVDGPLFAQFLDFMAGRDDVWCKVTCPERLSRDGSAALPGQANPYADVMPFARAVVEQFPNRVLWGTDWPHPNLTRHMPDDGLLVDVIPRIAPTTARQQALLVDNPMRLYWPEA